MRARLRGMILAPQLVVTSAAALQPQLDLIKGGGRLIIGDSLTYAQTPVLAVDG